MAKTILFFVFNSTCRNLTAVKRTKKKVKRNADQTYHLESLTSLYPFSFNADFCQLLLFIKIKLTQSNLFLVLKNRTE